MKGMKLVGGLLNLPDKNELAYPSNLIPVFKYNNEYYIQIAKKAKYLYSFLEDAEFQKIEDSQLENSNKSAFLTITDAKDINISMKVYLLALSKQHYCRQFGWFHKQVKSITIQICWNCQFKRVFQQKNRTIFKVWPHFPLRNFKSIFWTIARKKAQRKRKNIINFLSRTKNWCGFFFCN